MPSDKKDYKILKSSNIVSFEGISEVLSKLNGSIFEHKINEPIDQLIDLCFEKIEKLTELKLAIAQRESKSDYVSLVTTLNEKNNLCSIVIEHSKSKWPLDQSFRLSHLTGKISQGKTAHKKAAEDFKTIFSDLDNLETILKSEIKK